MLTLPSLAAKQKRAAQWLEFAHEKIRDESLRSHVVEQIESLREILRRCWENQSVSDADHANILDLERVLEQLNEEARLRVGSA